MKDKKEQSVRQEQSLVIDINLTRGLLILLALVLVAAACLGTLAWGQKAASADAQAAPAAFAGMRKYYLTQGGSDGDETLTACASGYHMASLWEILDPSNLEYNADLGFIRADSGAGPPTAEWGWIRTGWYEYTTNGAIGRANCSAWDSDAIFPESGTVAHIANSWTGGFEDMHVWDVDTTACDMLMKVWCVED